jgi:RNA polymerase sigma-70 factor (ECF subfamily)
MIMKGKTASEPRDRQKPAGSPGDEELMLRYQEGDVEAFNELVSRHGQTLYGFLVRLTGRRDRAEDAYQEVFLRVIRSATRYKPSASFTAWLYTIARNIVIDQARKDQRRAEESLDEPIGHESGITRLDMVADPGANPENQARGLELYEAVEKAIEGLSVEQREVLLLREKAGLSFKQIAKTTGAPLNTVKTRMHYALGHIRKALAGQGFWGEDAI